MFLHVHFAKKLWSNWFLPVLPHMCLMLQAIKIQWFWIDICPSYCGGFCLLAIIFSSDETSVQWADSKLISKQIFLY